MLPKTMDTITKIRYQVLHEKPYCDISKRFYASNTALNALIATLPHEQQDIVYDYMLANSEVNRAMMAIALHDDP